MYEELPRSNDWSFFGPRFVLAETLRTHILQLGKCRFVVFPRSVGYTPVCKAYYTLFFECICL